LPTGLRGTPPNLDAFAVGDTGTVCIESKFLETLTDEEAKFSGVYAAAVERLADPSWTAVYRDLTSNPGRYKRLDAGQLVKHYLGMRHSLKDSPSPHLLAYVFWEPTNWESFAEYRDHRGEVEAFAAQVAEAGVRFVALSYRELWSQWERSIPWEGIGEHIALLRARYEFEIVQVKHGSVGGRYRFP
jgi:hypothetical protein